MPVFGARSERNLATCLEPLVLVARDVIEVYDFAVTCGYRSNAEQAVLWAQGRTVPGKIVTWARPGESMHNRFPSPALDFAPWPIDWDDEQRFIEIAGAFLYVAARRGIALEWGGHWPKKKRDLPHLQLAV